MDKLLSPKDQHQAKTKSLNLVQKHIGLDPDEQILLLVRKHWVVFRNTVLLALFVPFVLLFLVYFLNQWPLDWDPNIIHWLTEGLLLLSVVCFGLGAVGFIWRWYIWNHTFYIMTSTKLCIINQYNPWNYEVQQISLSNINDVTLKQEGLESFLYGFSDVAALTYAGSTFTFKHVAHAAEVQKAIMQQLAIKKPDDGGFLNQVAPTS